MFSSSMPSILLICLIAMSRCAHATVCAATFTKTYPYSDELRIALLVSTCTGAKCSDLPTYDDKKYGIQSLASGRVFSSSRLNYNDPTWHYLKMDLTYTASEGDGNWCYLEASIGPGIDWYQFVMDQEVGCARGGWCTHTGGVYSVRDCTNDGKLDHVCEDGSSFGVFGGSECVSVWPNAGCRLPADLENREVLIYNRKYPLAKLTAWDCYECLGTHESEKDYNDQVWTLIPSSEYPGYYTMKSKRENKKIGKWGHGSKDVGAVTSDATDDQLWKFEARGSGWYVIVNKWYTDTVLAKWGPGDEDFGTFWRRGSDKRDQQWKIVKY